MRAMKILAVAAAFVVAFVSTHSSAVAAAQAHTQSADTTASIDEVVEQEMNDGGMVGVGAAIIVDKKIVWMNGYGFADKERAIAFTPDTVMTSDRSARPSPAQP